MTKTPARELIVWYMSECPDCYLLEKCPRSKGNIETCYLEDHMLFGNTPIEYLMKRALRFVCAEDRKEGKAAARRQKETAEKEEQGKYNAALFCADPGEFATCQR